MGIISAIGLVISLDAGWLVSLAWQAPWKCFSSCLGVQRNTICEAAEGKRYKGLPRSRQEKRVAARGVHCSIAWQEGASSWVPEGPAGCLQSPPQPGVCWVTLVHNSHMRPVCRSGIRIWHLGLLDLHLWSKQKVFRYPFVQRASNFLRQQQQILHFFSSAWTAQSHKGAWHPRISCVTEAYLGVGVSM